MSVGSSTYANMVSTNEINVSKPLTGMGTVNPKVSNKAFLHYMSPVTGAENLVTSPDASVNINTPFTVTNSSPLLQLSNNTTWYCANTLTYFFPPPGSVKEEGLNDASKIILYPNPSKNISNLFFEIKENKKVSVMLYNIFGKLLKTSESNCKPGENNIELDFEGLTSGFYMVKVRIGNELITKKLIIE